MENNPPEPAAREIDAPSSKPLSVAPGGGSMYHAFHVSRTVKTYPIQEHELLSLNDLSGNSTLWAFIGTAALTTVVGCIWSMITATPVPAGVVQPTNWPAVGFLLLAIAICVVSYFIAFRYSRKSKSRLQKILDECSQ
jgi:hypothetical protein